MYNLNNLTIVIVTFLTNKKTLLNCLNSINKKVKVIVVENSTKFRDRHFFLNKFKNLQIFCTCKNLGYGGGNNFGLKKINTDYALILNPDTVLDKSFFRNINPLLNNKSFSLIGCELINNKIYVTGGFFNEKKNEIFRKDFFKSERKNLTKVDWITGSSMLLNLKKIKKKIIFDENFFLYFEEFDFCMRLLKANKNIYLSKNLKIHHLGFKSSFKNNKNFNEESQKLRNWHYMWSNFYFYKKNYSYFYAFIKMSGKLFKALLKTIIFMLLLDSKKRTKYFYRFYGIISSMIGSKSFYRGIYF
jgi:N-acetylglucosaminyl-diphospho-decaprenol L-rhamnosyltransferase